MNYYVTYEGLWTSSALNKTAGTTPTTDLSWEYTTVVKDEVILFKDPDTDKRINVGNLTVVNGGQSEIVIGTGKSSCVSVPAGEKIIFQGINLPYIVVYGDAGQTLTAYGGYEHAR